MAIDNKMAHHDIIQSLSPSCDSLPHRSAPPAAAFCGIDLGPKNPPGLPQTASPRYCCSHYDSCVIINCEAWLLYTIIMHSSYLPVIITYVSHIITCAKNQIISYYCPWSCDDDYVCDDYHCLTTHVFSMNFPPRTEPDVTSPVPTADRLTELSWHDPSLPHLRPPSAWVSAAELRRVSGSVGFRFKQYPKMRISQWTGLDWSWFYNIWVVFKIILCL